MSEHQAERLSVEQQLAVNNVMGEDLRLSDKMSFKESATEEEGGGKQSSEHSKKKTD